MLNFLPNQIKSKQANFVYYMTKEQMSDWDMRAM